MADFSRAVLERHSLDMRQFIDFRQSLLANGMRAVEVYNSSGLTFTILPDRGLDIWTAYYNGLPLTWISQASPHPPDFASPWLRQFNGGLLTTCGLRHVGPPETDPVTGEQRDVHGLYTRLRAYKVSASGGWQGGRYVMELRGEVTEGQLFGEQLHVERAFRVTLGEPGFELVDVVTNRSDAPSPFMLLYHFNLGYPLVGQEARLYVPDQAVFPRDDRARAGSGTWDVYGAAQPEYAEQVFYHHVRHQDGDACVMLSNGFIGFELAWDTRTAPYLTQWKNLRQGIYVSGIEPGNCVPEGQNGARANGRLVTLNPGEQQTFTCRVNIVEGSDRIDASAARINAIKRDGQPVVGCRLS